MADTNISYIVIGSEIKGPEEKGLVDICTRIGEKGVSDKVLLAIKEVQAKMAKEVETILKENAPAEIENPAADPEKENQPQVKKVLTYKDGRPAYVEKEI